MQMIGVLDNGQRFINYDYTAKVPDNTLYCTIKEIDKSHLEAIKEATFEKVQYLLSYYI